MPWVKLTPPSKDEQAAVLERFGKKARFLVDESLDPGIAEALRELGWNARTAEELGLKGRCDADIFAAAWREKRILLTRDRDFMDDRRFPEHRNPGVIRLPDGHIDGEAVVEALRVVVGIIGPLSLAYRKTKIDLATRGIISVRVRNRSTGVIETQRFRLGKGDETWYWEGHVDT